MALPLFSLTNLTQPPTADQWATVEYQLASTLGLPTTSWQQGGVERTLFAILANLLQQADISGSIIAQAGFLDFAARGFVTYTSADGTTTTLYVTPDPSNTAQNPTGALGWLDVLAYNRYNERRTLQTYAGGALAILNTIASTYGPYAAGTYHVAQPGATGSPSYSNTVSVTIPPSTTIGSVSAAVNVTGLIRLTVAAHGLSTGDPVFVTGVGGVPNANGAWYVTVVNANQFILQGSTFAGAYTAGGTVYSPTVTTCTADSAGSASNASTANLVTQPITSLIGVSVANLDAWIGTDTESNTSLAAKCRRKLQALSPGGAAGAYEYYALAAQDLAPDLATPLEVSAPITRVLVVTDPLTGIVTVTIANASGAPSGDDVTAVDAVLEAYLNDVIKTIVTQAAAELAIACDVTVYLPAAYNTAATQSVIELAVSTYFQSVNIAGISNPGDGTNIFPIDGLRGAIAVALSAASIPWQDMDVTLDDGGGPVETNIQLALTPIPEVATLSPSPATVSLVSV